MRAPRSLALLAAGLFALAGQAQAQRISDLPPATSVNASDLIAIDQGGVTKRSTVGAVSGAGAALPSIATSLMLANISGSTGQPTGVTVSQYLNIVACSSTGSLLYRSGAGWGCLTLGTNGQVPTSNGSALVYQAASSLFTPAGTNGQFQYNNSGVMAGATLAAIASSGSASDLVAGTAPIARLPTGTVTSSSTLPLNNDGRLNAVTLYLPIGAPASATSTAAPSSDFLFSGALTYSIAASAVPKAKCGANPAGTLSIVLKKNGSSTLCTISLSTSCVVSGCSISATSFVTGDYITAESSADASATGIGVAIPMTKAN